MLRQSNKTNEILILRRCLRIIITFFSCKTTKMENYSDLIDEIVTSINSVYMNNKRASIGRWYIGFGIFLILCGIAGYASNPAAAKTALISGSTFGSLSMLWGFWMLKGGRLSVLIAAGLTTLMLCGAFSWRSVVSWQAYADGEPKLFAACLITAMLLASIASLIQLLRSKAALLQK